MNALVPKEFGAISTRFAGQAVENDLGAGVSGGYSHIGYKGKVWSIRHKGEETNLMRDDGDGPRGSIEIVILKAAQAISKVWYEKGYTEGSKEAPDCFSANGLTPDPSSVKKQCNVCATCPRNAFGSAIKQDGTPGKGKACSDSKRLAVVPMNDIDNEMLGGPMLLRVPASSLNDSATYGAGVQKLGFPYYAVATRIGFDVNDAYPKFVFSPIRPLTDAEADKVLALRNDARVDRILSETPYEAAPAQIEKPAMSFEQAQQPTQQPLAQPAMTNGNPVSAIQPAQPQAEAPKTTPSPRRRAAAKPETPAPVAAPVAAAPAQAPAPVKTSGFGAMTPAPAQASPATAQVDPAAAKAFDDALDAEFDEMMKAS
jgi:hypothetical protein